MRFDREHLIHKALVALDEAATQCGPAPLAPTFALRFALAYLYACSDGDRAPFDDFWRAVQDTTPAYSHEQTNYCRATFARTAWTGIARSVGAPSTIEYLDSIRKAQRPAIDRARSALAVAVRAAGREQRDMSQAKRDAQSCALDRPGTKR